MTDLPDAVVEAAAEAMKPIVPNSDGVLWEFEDTDPNTGEPVQPRPVTLHDAARAALAAASGPADKQSEIARLSEQLDAAELCEMPHPSHPEWLCERPKGHDAHRRPGDVWRTDEEAWVTMQAERDAARAELDNLRDRVNTLADECEKVPPANAEMNAWTS